MVKSSAVDLDLRYYSNVDNAGLVGRVDLDAIGNGLANELTGNGGANVITGRGGADILFGGAGRDVFKFNAVSDSGIDKAARDKIMDFVRGRDKVDLSHIDASISVAGNGAFDFIGDHGFNNKAGELRTSYINSAGTANDWTTIAGDVNGDAKADFIICAKGLIAFSVADFLL